jgi:hypothetical protein
MDLQQLVEEYGVKNLRFFIPLSKLQYAGFLPGIAFRCSGRPEESVECVICESRYKAAEGYKITLKALSPEYGKETYYQSDLCSIIRDNPEYKMFVLTPDGYTRIDNKVLDY